MEFNVPLSTVAPETPALGGAAAPSAGEHVDAAGAASAGAPLPTTEADADALLSAASFLLRVDPPSLKDFVIDVSRSRKDAMEAGAFLSLEHPRVETKIALSADDVVGALSELTCQPVESFRAHLTTAEAVNTSTRELRNQLEAAYRVVRHVPAQARLLELELLDAAALSKPPQAMELRYHGLHAPLREARFAICNGMADSVTTQKLLLRNPTVRALMTSVAARSPKIVGPRKLRQWIDNGDIGNKELILCGASVPATALASRVTGGDVVSIPPRMQFAPYIWRVEPAEESGSYRLALQGTETATEPRALVLAAPEENGGQYQCCARGAAKHDTFTLAATPRDGLLRLCSVTRGDCMTLSGARVVHISGRASCAWLPIEVTPGRAGTPAGAAGAAAAAVGGAAAP